MIEQTNITIHSKNTKKIRYVLDLDLGFWFKSEFDTRGNKIYFKTSDGDWIKRDFNSEGKRIYYENSIGIIRDDRKN